MDGQDAGEMLLNIEARIGELISQTVVRGKTKTKSPDAIILRDMQMNEHTSHQAQAIHRNPEAVKAIIAEAKKNEDIPTKTAAFIRA